MPSPFFSFCHFDISINYIETKNETKLFSRKLLTVTELYILVCVCFFLMHTHIFCIRRYELLLMVSDTITHRKVLLIWFLFYSTPTPSTDPKTNISCDPLGRKVLEDTHFLFIFVILTLCVYVCTYVCVCSKYMMTCIKERTETE